MPRTAASAPPAKATSPRRRASRSQNTTDVVEGTPLQFHDRAERREHGTGGSRSRRVAGTGGTPATAGDDFETTGFEYSTNGGGTWNPATGNQVTFQAGQTSMLVRIDTIDDALDEPSDERMTLTATVASGNAVIHDGSGDGDIDDNDGVASSVKPTISFSFESGETVDGTSYEDGDVVQWDGNTLSLLFDEDNFVDPDGGGGIGTDQDIDAIHVFTGSGTVLGQAYSAGDMLLSTRDSAALPAVGGSWNYSSR